LGSTEANLVALTKSGVLSHATRLEVTDHLPGFYLRQGFEVIGLIPDASGPGTPGILMAKRIGSSP